MNVTIPHSDPAPGSHPLLLHRRDPAVLQVMRHWRRLTGLDRPGTAAGQTLIACSGGADSSALVLALSAGGVRVVVGHVVHDMRSRAESLADRDAVVELANRVGAPSVEAEIRIGQSNKEAEARLSRYDALVQMAEATNCRFIATAHHANDQLETLMMALLRGAGPWGLAGIAERRTLNATTTLIRPMLECDRRTSEAMCERAGVEWQHDVTNEDTSRLRAALRHGPVGDLLRLRPDALEHALTTARLMADAAAMIDERAAAVFGESTRWARDALRAERDAVIGAGLRAAAIRAAGGEGADQFTSSVLEPVVRAIRDHGTEPRRFDWPRGVTVLVTASKVRLESGEDGDG